MLHLLGDSGYKLSIDKSPVYSIIYINKCADGKKYHTIPTVQRAAVWCKAVKPPRVIRPKQIVRTPAYSQVDFPDTKIVRISTVKGKCIDGCTEADLAYIYALLSL